MIALEYHDVVDPRTPDESGFAGRAAASYKLTPDEFASHCAALASVSGLECPDVRVALSTPSPRQVLLTFDDGGLSAHQEIAPYLERHRWCAHVFVPTNFIGKDGFADAIQLRDLHARGHVIGSHSCSHPLRMAALSATELRREWRDSVNRLSDVIGAGVDVASVPGGAYSVDVAAAAAASGVRVLFTSEPVTRMHSVSGCTVIGRFTLRRGMDGAAARGLVESSPVARSRQWLAWNSRKLAKKAGGSLYLRLRERLFEQ